MKTDYKLWYIKRDDDGFITEVAVRFYEGDVTTEQELEDGEMKDVTRYRRVKRLESFEDLKHLAKKVDGKDTIVGLKEVSGKVAVVYFKEDFGVISTDDELRSFLNKELAKDTSREPIDEQK